MKRVIELIRVSTEGQAGDDRASIPAQRAINRRTAQAYGLEIVRSIQMTDVSGAAVLLAPEMQQLLKLIEDPQIHGVIAREFSRLMRPENYADYGMLQVFADTKTVLYLPDGPLDFASKTGRLMGTMRAAFAGLERTEILERVWAAKEEKRRSGKLAQSEIVLPWGIGYTEPRGFFYKPETERLREVFRRFLAGHHNYVEHAEFVGVTPRGMYTILRNPIWTGWRVIDKKRDMSASARNHRAGGRQGDRRKINRAADEIIRVEVIKEPLVTTKQFQRVQQIMDTKQARHWRSQPESGRQFVYNGFLTCARCGSLVYTAQKTGHPGYYVCKAKKEPHTDCASTYMNQHLLETKLNELFGHQLTEAKFLRQIEQRMEEAARQGDGSMSRARLEAQAAKLKAKRQRVLDGYFEQIITREERDARFSTIDREIAAIEAVQPAPVQTISAETLAEIFSSFVEWEVLDRAERRALLAATVPEICVADYAIAGLKLSLAGSGEDSRSAGVTLTATIYIPLI